MNPEMYDQYQMQSDLQRQAGDSQMNSYAPQLHEQAQQTQAVLIAQTNPKEILREIELKLRGERERYDGTIEQISKPLMNQLGRSRILFFMDILINQNTILSHVEDREISKLIIAVGEDLLMDLAVNWREYGVNDRSMLNLIEKSVLIPGFLALKRALGQGEKNWLGKITVENISQNRGGFAPKKEGLLSKLRL